MTILKNLHFINILKKWQKKSLLIHSRSKRSEFFLRKTKKEVLFVFKESRDSNPCKGSIAILKKKRRDSLKKILVGIKKTKRIHAIRASLRSFASAKNGFGLPALIIKDKIKIQKKYGHRVKVKKSSRLAPAFPFSLQKRKTLQSKKLFISRREKRKRLFFRIKESAQLFTRGKKKVVTSQQLLFAKKSEYKKYNKKKRYPKQKIPIIIPRGAKIGKISIKGTYNNIILTLMDQEGNTKAWSSAGTAGFKNGRKSSHFAAESAVDQLARRSIALGYTFARIKMKGLGGGKRKAIRRFCKSNIQLLSVSDNLSIAYNGCRRARKPRK